jgi:D-threonate/D-erythronate kinase
MIGVIADDLTGAAEIGGVGLRHGLRAEIVLSGEPSGDADLICVDTDSRSCTAEEAEHRAGAAAELLSRGGADWIYKKVDSVLRGHVTPEIEAVLERLRLTRAVLVPANPSLGRTIKGERYFVRGKPIHRTEFGRDPEHPRTSAKVLELLGRPSSFSIRVCGINGPPAETEIAVGEASSAADLRHWASQWNRRTLAAGGAEFFEALLASQGLELSRTSDTSLVSRESRELFVSGTASQSARDFVRDARAAKTPVFPLPSELAWGAELTTVAMDAVAGRIAAAFRTHPRVLLHVGLPWTRGPAAARLFMSHLVQIASRVLRQARIDHVYADGGATAAALAHEMGWNRLNVLREMGPGVVTLSVDGDSLLLFTIKPGSYTWPDVIRHPGSITAPA